VCNPPNERRLPLVVDNLLVFYADLFFASLETEQQNILLAYVFRLLHQPLFLALDQVFQAHLVVAIGKRNPFKEAPAYNHFDVRSTGPGKLGKGRLQRGVGVGVPSNPFERPPQLKTLHHLKHIGNASRIVHGGFGHWL
jgi:hypothetical protein